MSKQLSSFITVSFLVLILSTLGACSNQQSSSPLTGKYQGAVVDGDDEVPVGLEFLPDYKVLFPDWSGDETGSYQIIDSGDGLTRLNIDYDDHEENMSMILTRGNDSLILVQEEESWGLLLHKVDEFDTQDTESQTARAIQSEAKTYVGSMNRAQQAYYLEEGVFADDIPSLGLGIDSNTDDYRYTMNAYHGMVFNVAEARGDFKSYFGTVTIADDTTTAAEICETDDSTVEVTDLVVLQRQQLLNNPGAPLSCPPGSHSLE